MPLAVPGRPSVSTTMSPMSRLALFDLDNTLIDRQAAFAAWAATFARRHDLGEQGVTWLMAADDDGFATRATVFDGARATFDLTASTDELIEDYRRDYPSFVGPDDAVNRALGELRSAGWTIGIVTNGPPSQHVKIAQAGLAALVDVVCVSEEVGVAKPDRAIFAEAARRAGTTLEELDVGWMVGDAPHADVAGGLAAGLRTVWMRRGRRWPEPAWRPEVTVDDIPQAVDHLLGDGTGGPGEGPR